MLPLEIHVLFIGKGFQGDHVDDLFFSITPLTAAISPTKVFPELVGLEIIRQFPSKTLYLLMALS